MSRRWSQNAGLIGVDGKALFGVHDLRSARQRVLDGNWANAVTNQSYTPTHETITFSEGVAGGAHNVGTVDNMSLAYLGTTENGATLTSGSSHTFSSFSIGTATSDRHIVVGVGVYTTAGNTISSVTVGGVTATGLGTEQNGSTSACRMFVAKVTTGTTADIVVTMSATDTSWDVGIGVWSIQCAGTLYTSSNGNSTTSNITVTSNGYEQPIIGVGFNVNGSAGTSSITNADSVTERFDTDIRSSEFFSGVDGLSNAIGNHSVDPASGVYRVATVFSTIAP